MKWLFSTTTRERRLAMRRRRRLRQALGLYGLNEGDGLPTEAELELERDAALIELLRDYRLFYGTPEWARLQKTVVDAAAAESQRITEAGGREFYAHEPRARAAQPEP